MGFSVNALFYGDRTDLAVRLLKGLASSADWSLIDEVRFGCNACRGETLSYVHAVAERLPAPARVFVPWGDHNVGKYTLMRRMFHGDRQTRTPGVPAGCRVMWFDDDSAVADADDVGWWCRVWRTDSSGVLGASHKIGQRGKQYAGIRAQPWYGGLPVGPDHVYRFCTGGWWVSHIDFLRGWGYPFDELHHNGGDSILGELCRQGGRDVVDFREGVIINCDGSGRINSSPRRGITTKWPWQDYPADRGTAHHDFSVDVTGYGVSP